MALLLRQGRKADAMGGLTRYVIFDKLGIHFTGREPIMTNEVFIFGKDT
jgi:hypothetical protein